MNSSKVSQLVVESCWMSRGLNDKSGNPSYNCLAAIDYKCRFRYFGIVSGINADQSCQRCCQIYICPPGVVWLRTPGSIFGRS
ncbi:hypothetical protein GQ600_10146 [Phytophthora cactorum]|nr:hypothetical protein GQ600_10146 [Phytophthora cactorum]